MEDAQGKVIHHICHKHPLTPTDTPGNGNKCFGCQESFSPEDAYAYGCIVECEDQIFLHKKCAEMRRKLKHGWEKHIIHQKVFGEEDLGKPLSKCTKCKESIDAGLYYKCVKCCDYTVHLRCCSSWFSPWRFVYNDDDVVDDRMMTMAHPSHKHSLRMLKRESSFRCDACGRFGNERGSSYICILCEYWIHEGCALLPPVIKREKHHNHSLSVAYFLPHLYSKFEYSCDICGYDLQAPLWVYHCETCSYVVHIRCGLRKSPPIHYSIKSSKSTHDKKAIIQFPISDVSEELIRHFVIRGGGKTVIPHGDEITKNTPKYKFHKHPHPLRLSSSGENNTDIDDDDDDKDDLEHGRRSSELICDGCITPIHHKKIPKSSSSSTAQKYYYYSCDECKYFLHSACFNLPSTLPSHPLHDYHKQHIVLQTSRDLIFNHTSCNFCGLHTNGLFYTCTECNFFTIDIKCASLPNVIKHASHPGHTLKLSKKENLNSRCGVCGSKYGYRGAYNCDRDCKFSLHLRCALLPATNEHRRDKHPLPLTYDAYVNHPGEFYCDVCEKEMNPKMWMYHCRECDQSIHPDCFPASSGQYRSIKFGQEVVIATCHDPHHPLMYQLISRKGCCDLCGGYKYGDPGFECTCCHFVMCFDPCGKEHKNAVRAKH